ncbi:MAG TPA: ABC transporter ATP-binding protein [Clostridiales bacterium]|nr:MAG: ABC transporter ATP-binding protein YtrB [Firmicutes bacterium ADurb.Bin262]HOU09395.1 ABC transporter ATP-binding protein [Clostridiales bacterium]HQH62093.1 ABC transporter ATP-binding protein [Clostridiales bacterium]HQK72309.1 ABC transporter ATP-binding protein [Clostridiales bacterium]
MSNIIEVKNLSKSYGKQTVLDDISFAYEPGQTIGLLGPNGCGKTTLIKIMTGLINDYSGTVLIDGHKPDIHTKAMIAYLPEKTYLADWMRPVDTIRYFSDFYADFDTAKAKEMLIAFDLPEKQKIKSMSKGMQEKLQLLLVMCRNARLYVLDEPLGGVDPAARAFILDVIMKNRPGDSTMFISTHLIYDVERIFDTALMIGRGKILVNAGVNELRRDGKTIEDKFKEVFGYAWQVN